MKMRRQLQINLIIEDGKAVGMEAIVDGMEKIQFVQELEKDPMKKIEVLQAMHELADKYME